MTNKRSPSLFPAACTCTRFADVVLEQMRADGSLTELYDTWMQPTVREPAPAVPKAVYRRNIRDLQRQS